MKYIITFLLAFCATYLNAQMLISPYDALQATYGKDVAITKKNIVLKKAQAKAISQDAKLKLYSKIIRVFTIKQNDNTIAHAILISRVMRTKTVVALYIIEMNQKLKSTEIIAFNEPIEYLPSNTWLDQLTNISTKERLRVAKDIPTITGATLTARALVDGSRVAFAFYKEIIQDKL